MKRTESQFLLFIATSLMISCSGGGSDPLAKYDLRDTGTPDQTKEKQTLLQSGKISVELISEGESSQNIINNFIEGQSSQLKFKVIVNDPKVLSYQIRLSKFPNIDQPIIEATSTSGLYMLNWTPPKGFTPPGQTGQSINVNWEVQVLTATLPELVGYVQSGSFPINISRSTLVPQIVSYDKFQQGIDEDQLIPFTVTVEDPNSKSENQIPFLSFTGVPYLNTEAFCADFAGRLQIDSSRSENPERLSETKWKFYYQMDTHSLPIDRNRVGNEDPNAPTVDVCFYLSAVSGVGQTTSAKFKVNIKARYSVKTPELKWDDETLQEVPSGQETKIRFSVGVDNKDELALNSQLSFPRQTIELAKLPGEKSLTCTPNSLDKQIQKNCELSWKPICTQNQKTVTVNFTVRNTLGQRYKEKLWKRDFIILPSTSPCSKEKAK